jgi:hypothetical protein
MYVPLMPAWAGLQKVSRPLVWIARFDVLNGMVTTSWARSILKSACPGVKQSAVGRWLTCEQANELLIALGTKTLGGLRDRSVLTLMLLCGLHAPGYYRSRLVIASSLRGASDTGLGWEKYNRRQTLPVPAAFKACIEDWTRWLTLTHV